MKARLNTDVNREISGFFLTFTDKEKEEISRMLYDYGYSEDMKESLKKFIIDSARDHADGEEEEERPGGTDRFVKMLMENPDKIIETGERIGKGIHSVVQMMRNKKRAGRR